MVWGLSVHKINCFEVKRENFFWFWPGAINWSSFTQLWFGGGGRPLKMPTNFEELDINHESIVQLQWLFMMNSSHCCISKLVYPQQEKTATGLFGGWYAFSSLLRRESLLTFCNDMNLQTKMALEMDVWLDWSSLVEQATSKREMVFHFRPCSWDLTPDLESFSMQPQVTFNSVSLVIY